MSPEIEHLISLQVTDREIQRLKAEIAELPKVVAAIEQKLAGTKAGLEKARAAVKTTKPRNASMNPPSRTCGRKFPSIVTSRWK